MNNKFYDIPKDWYKEFNETFMNSNNNSMGNMFNSDNSLAEAKTAFLRGNLFNDLYEPYKGYKYRELIPSNMREEQLYNILKYNFVLVELMLYLDVNPNDREKVNLYNKYLIEKKQLIDEYEKKYGPLTMDGMNMGDNKWNWIDRPWPWEVIR